ncbi:MAG: hypothetical protein ACR2P5_07965 [Gammaproteobacteria bacterium]
MEKPIFAVTIDFHKANHVRIGQEGKLGARRFYGPDFAEPGTPGCKEALWAAIVDGCLHVLYEEDGETFMVSYHDRFWVDWSSPLTPMRKTAHDLRNPGEEK